MHQQCILRLFNTVHADVFSLPLDTVTSSLFITYVYTASCNRTHYVQQKHLSICSKILLSHGLLQFTDLCFEELPLFVCMCVLPPSPLSEIPDLKPISTQHSTCTMYHRIVWIRYCKQITNSFSTDLEKVEKENFSQIYLHQDILSNNSIFSSLRYIFTRY
jgi:hypothetical protein